MIEQKAKILRRQLDELMTVFDDIKHTVLHEDRQLYERWKAGGFAVDGNFISMYPAIEEVVENLVEGSDDEDSEDEPQEGDDDYEGPVAT
jgi:hypothetical protein